MSRGAVWGLALAALTGCGPQPVLVDVSFPSTRTFLFSETARLLVYEASPEQPEPDCPGRLARAMADDFSDARFDSGWAPVCDFRSGTVAFDDVPEGPHAYLVLARDRENTILLSGCRVAEAYEGAPSITVTMFPSDEYEEATMGATPSCSTPEDKCRGGC